MKKKIVPMILIMIIVMAAIPLAVLADNLEGDGDYTVPVDNNPVELGTVAAGSSATGNVLLAIVRSGSTATGNVFQNNGSVTVSVASTGARLSAAMTDGSIILPSDWISQSNNTQSSDTASSTVTLTVPAGFSPGDYAGQVRFSASGLNTAGSLITRETNVTVRYTVVAAPVDTTPPVLEIPANIIVEATGPDGAAVNFTATAIDPEDGPVPVTCNPASGSTFPLGTTTVNCSTADSSGNTAAGSFTVTVVDTTPPELILPSNMTVQVAGSCGAIVNFTATAIDLVDGPVPVTCNPASGSTFPLGTTTVNCSTADSSGNTATGSFTVTVKPGCTIPHIPTFEMIKILKYNLFEIIKFLKTYEGH